MRFVAGHNERFAPGGGSDQAVDRDGGGVVVVGHEGGERGDVPVGAVFIAGPGDELLRGPFPFHHPARWVEVHAQDSRRRLGVVWRAGFQPLHQDDVVLALHGELLAAGMRHGTDALLDEQAVLGRGQIDAANADFAGQPIVVPLRVEAEQREAEAVLAASRPVATARVAAAPHEDRHHIQLKADPSLGGGFLHGNRGDRFEPLILRFERGLAIHCGIKDILILPHQIRRGDFHRALAGDIQRHPVIAGRHHNEPLQVLLGLQVDVRRIDVERGHLGLGVSA